MNKQHITFNSKPYVLDEIVPGVLKFNTAYLLFDRATNVWKYCNQARLDKLSKKYKGVDKLGANYESRSQQAVYRAAKKALQPKPVKKPEAKPVEDKSRKTSSGLWVDPSLHNPREK